jgi:hypothetical protein
MPDYYALVRQGLGRDHCPNSPQKHYTWRRRKSGKVNNEFQTNNAVAFVHDDCLKINICPNCINTCIAEINAYQNARAYRDQNFQGDLENRVVIVLDCDPDDKLRAVLMRWLQRGRNEVNDCQC